MHFEELKNRFGERAFANKNRSVPVAIDIAYADMSRRQSGHTPELKEACIGFLADVFSSPLHISDFDAWHEALAAELISRWNRVTAGFGTVGKAQKVINMAFKYLSCISHDYDALLPHCHMTLDSYTLEWYDGVVTPWAREQHREVGEKASAWSKIESYDEYLLIQRNIRDYLAAGATYSISIGTAQTDWVPLPAVPVDAEFIVWEGQIISRKYNGLIKTLEQYAKENKASQAGQENDAWLLGDLFREYLKDYMNRF